MRRFLILGLAALVGCATSGGGGGGGGGGGTDDANVNQNTGPDDGNVNQNTSPDDGTTENENQAAPNDNDDSGPVPASPGAAAFAANDCDGCHTAQSNNFSGSTVDSIVDALVGDVPHAGADLTALSEEDFDLITDYLVAVALGEEQLDGVSDDGEENENADTGDEDNDNAGPDDDSAESEAHAWFEQVWTDFDRNYSHFAVKEVDWDAVRTEYEPRFEADLTDDQFLTNLAEMLAGLRDVHVWLFDAQGESVEVYSKPAAQNYPSDDPAQYFPQGLQQMQSFPLTHGWTTDNIAYIGIDSFDADRWDGLHTGHVDDLFAAYADADGLIIDVRRNNGGSELVAQVLAGHLSTTAYVYGYHRTKNPGPDHSDFADFTEHRLEPAENDPFLKPVACLIGQRNLSSAEWWVLMMSENLRGITLIGDTTRGSSGSPQEFSLDNGITYYIPSWEAYRVDQTTRIEDVGIDPTPGFAIPAEESYTTDHDFVLERAVDLLTQ
ncbi:MAG TPA: S41 family peptidase [Phycisphaerae bacterium]|nr:S41 family peptidase [Phycisphaerae bacterium]